MVNEIRILHPDQIYPENSGGYSRTFNIAKLATNKFNTNIFGIHNKLDHESCLEGVHLVQEKKYGSAIEKYYNFYKGLFSKNYTIWNPRKAFENFNIQNTIFQIEGPYTYNALKNEKIKKFILDEHNVYWELSKFPSFNLKYKIYNLFASKRDKLLEIKSIKNASHILVCSERDKKIIVNEIPVANEKITIIPNCVDYLEYQNYLKVNRKQKNDNFNVLFMGMLTYSPNTLAVYDICNEIAPKFKNDVQFNIIGKNPPKIDAPENVKFWGYVDDLKIHILDNDICIAPLKLGSGTRFKILEYMAMKKTVISTSKGAEGIDYVKNKNIIIEDDIGKYAEIINELIDNKQEMNRISTNAVKLIKDKYNWSIYKNKLLNVYSEVLDED